MRKYVIVAATALMLASGGVAMANGDPTEASHGTGVDRKVVVNGRTTQLNLLDLGDQGSPSATRSRSLTTCSASQTVSQPESTAARAP